MADGNIWQIVTAVGAAGTASVFGLLAIRVWSGIPKFMEQWLALRQAKALEKAADWSRRGDLLKDQGDEIKRLGERCKRLEAAEEKCRNDLADAKERIATLEGYNIGEGKALNEAQRILSAEREADAEKRAAGPQGNSDG